MLSGKRKLFIGLAVLAVTANFTRAYIHNAANTAMEQGLDALSQEDYYLAISAYTRADKLIFWDKEKKAENLHWRGAAYYEKQDYVQALADFAKAINLRPNYYQYYIWRARTHYSMNNHNLAIADYSKSIKLQGKDSYGVWDTYFVRANAYFLNNDYALAIADYTKAIDLRPDNYLYYTSRAHTYHSIENYDLAIADYSKSIELQGKDSNSSIWDTYLERASAYSLNEDFALAVADYDRAISALDEKIISPYTSSDEIDELKKKRDDAVSKKEDTKWEKHISGKSFGELAKEVNDWKKNNPGKDFMDFMEWIKKGKDASGN